MKQINILFLFLIYFNIGYSQDNTLSEPAQLAKPLCLMY